MTLVINNKDVAQVLTMEDTIDALERAYRDLATREAVCRPRIDIRIPTSDPSRNYQWGSMEGGSPSGYFAVRMKSDIVYEQTYNGVLTQEKYCVRPGLYCGLILLTSVETGEPLAFINDGVLQHMIRAKAFWSSGSLIRSRTIVAPSRSGAGCSPNWAMNLTFFWRSHSISVACSVSYVVQAPSTSPRSTAR